MKFLIVNDEEDYEETLSLNPNKKFITKLNLFRRFLLRGSLLGKIITFDQDYHDAINHNSCIKKFLSANAVPIYGSLSKSFQAAYTIRNSLHDFFGIAWPAALAGLLINDFYQYINKFSYRYDTSYVDLIIGSYRKNWGLSGNHDDGFPNDWKFWMLPASLLATPLLFMSYDLYRQFHYLANERNIIDTLDRVAKSDALDTSKYFKTYVDSPYPAIFKKSWGQLIKHCLPFSDYRQSLQAASFILSWKKSYGIDPVECFDRMAELAVFGSPFVAYPALNKLAEIADSQLYIETSADSAHMIYPTVKAENKLHKIKTSDSSSWWRREQASYSAWTVGMPTNIFKQIAYSFRPLLLWTFTGYALFRYFNIIIGRAEQAFNFYTEKTACDNQQLQWRYSPITGNYACTICGDWSFIPSQLANDANACFQGLMIKAESIVDLFGGLARLDKYSSYEVMDLSNWHISDWNESLTSRFIQNITAFANEWRIVNLSTTNIVAKWPADNKLQLWAEFLNQHPTTILDLSNQNIDSYEFNVFLNQWHHPANLSEIYLSNNQLGDLGMSTFSNWTDVHNLKISKLYYENNKLTDNGLIGLLSTSSSSHIQQLEISTNDLTGQSLAEIADWLPQSNLKILGLSKQDLSNANYEKFGSSLARSKLEVLNLANIGMTDESFTSFAKGHENATSSFFNTLDISRNSITQLSFLYITNFKLKQLNIAYNSIVDEDLDKFKKILATSTWEGLDVSGNSFSIDALANFWSALRNSTVKSIIANNLNLDEKAFYPLIDLFKQGMNLTSINLSNNQFSSQFAAELIDAACRSNVSTIILNDNNLISIFNQNTGWNSESYGCKKITLAGNPIEDQAGSIFFNVMMQSKIESIDISHSALGSEAAKTLALSLIDPIINPIDLTKKDISYDETRALNCTDSISSIKSIRLTETNITGDNANILCHIQPHLPETTLWLEQSVCSSSSHLMPWFKPFLFWQKKDKLNELSEYKQYSSHQIDQLFEQKSQSSPDNFQLLALDSDVKHSNNLPKITTMKPSMSFSLLVTTIPFVNTLLLMLVLYKISQQCIATINNHRFSLWTQSPKKNLKQESNNTSLQLKK